MSSPMNYFPAHGPLGAMSCKSVTPLSNASSALGSPVVEDDSLVVSEFQLNFRLGEGGYGTVYAATHTRTNKRFAIKVVQRNSFRPGAEKQLLQEAVIMQSLRHVHVVQFIKLLRTRDEYYFVMDLAENGELFDLIISSKCFSEAQARKYFQQLMSALSYCHSQGVAHRDLKAENLLLDRNNSLLVCDFGFSCKRLPFTEDNDVESRPDEFMCSPEGTCKYTSPEAFAALHDSSKRVLAMDPFSQDLWAAGVILFFMLSGELPFNGRDEEETIFIIEQCEPNWNLIESSQARAYLKKILAKDSMERLSLQQMIHDPWFQVDLDESLFPVVVETDSDSTSDRSTASQLSRLPSHHFGHQDVSMLMRRPSSRMFLDFTHSPEEPVSPTEQEELIIRRAFKAIDIDGYGDHFTFDELRDALILLKKSTVDSVEVKELISLLTCGSACGNGRATDSGKSKDIVTYEEFRNAWINKDLAHCQHRDSQYFQLFQLANLTHIDCEQNIVRQLREAFDSVDELHTGVITLPLWQGIFEKAHIDVSEVELKGLLHYWNSSLPEGSGCISFEDFVAGIVKRDILLKHPLGKKLSIATNLSGFAQLRNLDQSSSNGFLVVGMREHIADKLILASDRLNVAKRTDRQYPAEIVITFYYRRDPSSTAGQSSSPHVTSPGSNASRTGGDSPQLSALNKKSSSSYLLSSSAAAMQQLPASTISPSKSAANNISANASCQLDVILCPTACVGFTLVKLRRISGLTAEFHECVNFVTSLLEREREQANIDSCVRGDSEYF